LSRPILKIASEFSGPQPGVCATSPRAITSTIHDSSRGHCLSLSTNEVRARAAEFAREWKDARYEAGEKQTFYDEFFRVFGKKRRQVATFEEPVKKLGGKRGFIDLFWKGNLLVEHKSAGGDLVRAKRQPSCTW